MKPLSHQVTRLEDPPVISCFRGVSCLKERIHEKRSGITPIFATLFIPKTFLKVMPVSDSPGQVGLFLFCVIISTSTVLSLDLRSQILRKERTVCVASDDFSITSYPGVILHDVLGCVLSILL